MEDHDQTLAQAAQEAEAAGDTTAAERIRAAAQRDEAAAEASDTTAGDTLSPDVPPKPDAASSGEADQESGEPATLSPDPLPESFVDCPVCKGEGKVPEQLRHAPDFDTCPNCAGLGVVGTGSMLSEHAVVQCRRCMGNGYVDTPQPYEPEPQRSESQPNAWEAAPTPRY